MFIDAREYVNNNTKEYRQKHLNLYSDCWERGGNSTNHRGVLAEFLKTTIPKGRIILAHACLNGKCSNPRHLYWGTDRENIVEDEPNRKSVWQRSVDKYGYEEACNINRKGDKFSCISVGDNFVQGFLCRLLIAFIIYKNMVVRIFSKFYTNSFTNSSRPTGY